MAAFMSPRPQGLITCIAVAARRLTPNRLSASVSSDSTSVVVVKLLLKVILKMIAKKCSREAVSESDDKKSVCGVTYCIFPVTVSPRSSSLEAVQVCVLCTAAKADPQSWRSGAGDDIISNSP